ncbi:hypothetical protein RZS08_03825, partial [Arthrospira platensis SPKY1]|nr:hypothetical protein [Arthrospira platensis SPKY1]
MEAEAEERPEAALDEALEAAGDPLLEGVDPPVEALGLRRLQVAEVGGQDEDRLDQRDHQDR